MNHTRKQSPPLTWELPPDTSYFGRSDLENFPEVKNIKSTEGVLSFSIDLQKFDANILKHHSNANFKEAYDTRAQTKGLCLIINNKSFRNHEERLGTDVDGSNLLNLFKQLGYIVSVLPNQTATEMKTECEKFILNPEHDKYNSCILVILSHGADNWIFGSDSKPVHERADILNHFNHSECKLKRKPKLVIIQACRTKLQTFDIAIQHSEKELNSEEAQRLGEQLRSDVAQRSCEKINSEEAQHSEKQLNNEETQHSEKQLNSEEAQHSEKQLNSEEAQKSGLNTHTNVSHDGQMSDIIKKFSGKKAIKKVERAQLLNYEIPKSPNETLTQKALEDVDDFPLLTDPSSIKPTMPPEGPKDEYDTQLSPVPNDLNRSLNGQEVPLVQAYDLLAQIRKMDQKDLTFVQQNIIPDFADLLIAHSTIPGYLSWRDNVKGSLFVQAIVEVFSTKCTHEHVADMLTMANDKVSEAIPSSGEKRASPCPMNHLRRKFYFFPPCSQNQ